jgi:uncharacterized membrane protein YdjX (TVP38/TMEM64 family)
MERPPGSRFTRKWIVTWCKTWGLSLAGLILAVAIIITIMVIYFRDPDLINDLQGYGYLGAFIISVILNATVLLPVSNMAVMVSLGATLPVPLLVGVAGGIGAGIGEFTGYLLGRSGRELVARNTMYNRLETWVKRWGWVGVFLLSVFPLVFDVIGIIAGALRMPPLRFFAACSLGRIIAYSVAAYLGSIWLRSLPWWVFIVLFCLFIIAGILIGLCKKKDNKDD